MNSPRDDEVFDAALARPAAERATYLARACAGDDALRARIDALLAGHHAAQSFLTSPLTAQQVAAPIEQAGERIGRYQLLEKIGEGGCGTVWLAEQEEPVRRRVALKVIKLGMDTKEVIARFEAERQALALMDHPNIAKVFDAGVSGGMGLPTHESESRVGRPVPLLAGRPFFVMELVRGIPITRYCDEHNLPTARRLELFISVCHAIQHAHQKGIIHRDLKPSNILVAQHDDVPVPKVIDFGIAKATHGPLTDKTLFTAFQQFIGTPVYMSPEQADLSSVDIDTRSDIYSLGVLLYELLAGAPPFDPKTLLAGGVDEIRRIIREVEPARPSTRVATLGATERTTLARQRGTAPAQLTLALRGDLDWIVMRCLEKDRARRYETANALAADLRRHLAHEPVVARPPSAAYVLQKLFHRHRLAFLSAAAIAATLIIGIAASTWQAVRATRAEQAQSRLRETAENAQAAESVLRQLAETQERATRRRAYAADMNLAQQSLAMDNLGRARELLDRHRPKPGEPDLRGWEWRYLWQFCRSEAISVLAHRSLHLALSADGQWLVSSKDGPGPPATGFDRAELLARNLRTQEEIVVPAPPFPAYRLAFSPRESLVAAAGPAFSGGSPQLFLWNVDTRRAIATRSLTARCLGVYFSADGRTVLTITPGRQKQFSFWRASDGELLRTISVGLSVQPPVAVSPDLRRATVEGGGGAKELCMIDLDAGVVLWSAAPPAEARFFQHAFSADGQIIAASPESIDTAIRLYAAESGREIVRLEATRAITCALLFSPDGRSLIGGGADQTIRFWDVATGRVLRTLRGHSQPVKGLALMPDGLTVLSGSEDGRIMMWAMNAGRAPAAHSRLPVRTIGWNFADGGASVISVDSEGNVSRWRGDGWRQRESVMHVPSLPLQRQVFVGGNCALIAVDRRQGGVEVWDWERRAMVRELAAPGEVVQRVTIVGADRILIAGTSGLQEWNLGTGEVARSAAGIATFFADAEGAAVVATARSQTWMIDWRTGERRQSGDLHRAQWPAGAFSPDGRLVVVDGWNITRVLSTETLKLVKALATSDRYPGVVFSPDSRRMVTVAGKVDGIRLWDVGTWEPVLTLDAPALGFRQTEFSADGNTFGASNGFGELHLWRAPSWAEIEAAEKENKIR